MRMIHPMMRMKVMGFNPTKTFTMRMIVLIKTHPKMRVQIYNYMRMDMKMMLGIRIQSTVRMRMRMSVRILLHLDTLSQIWDNLKKGTKLLNLLHNNVSAVFIKLVPDIFRQSALP